MKKSTFWKIYRKIIFILFIFVFVTWGVLWLFLDSYEKGRPTHFADEVVTWYEKGSVNKISKYVKLKDNGFNTIKYLRESLKDNMDYKNLSYTKNVLKYKNSKPVYSIISDGKEVASLTLKKNGKGLFGINRWKIESINPGLELEDITIYVPDSVNVTVNGNLLDMNSLKEENVYTEDLEVFKDYTDVKGLYKYIVKDMYKNREVKVSNGSITLKNNIYTFKYDENDELLNSLKDSLSSWCQNYTRYVLKEAYFGDIAGMVVSNSETYKLLRGVSNTNLWSGNHTPTEFGEIKFDNMEVFSYNAFKVDVHYTYSFDAEVGHQEDEANLTLYMLNENGNWKILKLNT